MAILTIPPGLSKGTPFTVSLDKSALFSLNSVASNPHFSNQANIATCLVKYEGSVPGALLNQARLMRFDMGQMSPGHTMSVSSAGANLFTISQILLVDHDGAVFAVPVSEVPALNLNFSGAGGGGESPILSLSVQSITASSVTSSWNLPAASGDSVQLFSTSNIPLSQPVSLAGGETQAVLQFEDVILDNFIAVGDTVVVKYVRNANPIAQAETTFPITDGVTVTLINASNHGDPYYYQFNWAPAAQPPTLVMGKNLVLQKQDPISGLWVSVGDYPIGFLSSGEEPFDAGLMQALPAGTMLRLRVYTQHDLLGRPEYISSNQVVSSAWQHPFVSN